MPDTRPVEACILDAVIDRLLDLHPLPWKVDRDWLPEVMANDGATIAMSIAEPDLAEKIVAYAKARHAQRQQEMINSPREMHEIEKMLAEDARQRHPLEDSMDSAFGLD
jgi:hypothetical protein